jgi:predicted AlkP superfamily pyrophosphatase or phosphodiesterase
MLAETTPNHVSMITGMRSDRHGMPGNGVPFLEDNIGLEPRYLQADSIFTLAHVQAPDLRRGHQQDLHRVGHQARPRRRRRGG